MSIARRIAIAAAILAGLAAATGCTPEEVKAFQALPPAAQQDVLEWLQSTQRPAGCVEGMRAVWPENLWSWAERIMWRESNHVPTARNASGASGCFQMMLPLHAGRFRAVGCSPADWTNGWCNAAAAYNLYREAGSSPWAATR